MIAYKSYLDVLVGSRYTWYIISYHIIVCHK